MKTYTLITYIMKTYTMNSILRVLVLSVRRWYTNVFYNVWTWIAELVALSNTWELIFDQAIKHAILTQEITWAMFPSPFATNTHPTTYKRAKRFKYAWLWNIRNIYSVCIYIHYIEWLIGWLRKRHSGWSHLTQAIKHREHFPVVCRRHHVPKPNCKREDNRSRGGNIKLKMKKFANIEK